MTWQIGAQKHTAEELCDEVNKRWSALFPEGEPLMLRPDRIDLRDDDIQHFYDDLMAYPETVDGPYRWWDDLGANEVRESLTLPEGFTATLGERYLREGDGNVYFYCSCQQARRALGNVADMHMTGTDILRRAAAILLKKSTHDAITLPKPAQGTPHSVTGVD